jgi:hypothetical protein
MTTAVSALAYSLSVPRQCRFCGTTDRKITNEHVWPEWLQDFIPPFSGLGRTERWSSASGRQQWRQELLAATVRMFCDSCNNGWMSDIEGAAKDIVGPMVQGVATTLDAAAQRTVADWVVLKGLVAAQTSSPPQPIPDRHYDRVYSAKGSPANTVRVWIGQRRSLADPLRHGRARLFDSHFMPVTNVARQFPMPPDLNRYVSEGGVFNATIFQAGHLFGLALHHDWPGLEVRPIPGRKGDGAFVQVWPTGGVAQWPPPHPVDGLGDPHRVTELFQMRPAPK